MMELLSKYHKLWISMGLSIGIREDIVEDFIHEMYLKIDKYVKDPKKIMYNETDINKFYIYVTIKNLWNDYLKEKNKHKMVRLDQMDYMFEGGNEKILAQIGEGASLDNKIDKDLAEEKLVKKIKEEVNSWERWYDQKLFKIYYETDISMRKLAKDSHISVTSIFNSCKNYKQIISSKFNEDYQDYINGDFHLIK